MSARRHFATTAHAGYLPRLQVLHGSMRQHCGDFVLHVLAEGAEVERWARAQEDARCAPVGTFLSRHPAIAPDALPGPPRTGNELACTWRWWFVADLLAEEREPVLLVDADIMFWSSPEPVFAEVAGARAAVLPHGFAPAAAGAPGVTIESHAKYGVYNGGFSYWADVGAATRMAALARACSRADFHEWPNGRVTWGDQGALSLVEEEFGAHVIRHPGAAPGPWCIHAQPLEQRDGVVHFGGRPLVSWHYHGLHRISGGGLAPSHPEYGITPEQERLLYGPYYLQLAEAENA